jgi:glycosyltransferase involved in cell wall biosynthesis
VKILIYTSDFAPSIGGVQTITAILAQGLVEWSSPANGQPAEANDVTIVTRTPAAAMDDSRFPFRVVRCPSPPKLCSLIRKTEVLHIVGPAILPMTIGLLFRKPVAVQHDGYQAVCPSGIYLHQPDAVLCPGHFQNGRYLECFRCQAVEVSRWRSFRNIILMFPRRWLAKRVTVNIGASDHTGRRITLPRTQTIYHGIEEPLAAPPRQSAAPKLVCFAYLGRLVPEKGVDLLLRAAAKVKNSGRDFRLRIIGDGQERASLESLAEQLSLRDRVDFFGYRTGNQLLEIFGDVSVNVIPSRWEEACPLTAIEQMMRGLLIIASELGGIGEVVGEAGLKFPPDDVDALAACISRAIDNPGLISSLGEAARRRALLVFSKQKMMHEHLALYGQVVQASGAVRD